jgi:hypothetical protein
MSLNKILDDLPLWPLIIIGAVFMAMPFGAPHLLAKIQMLRDGVPLAAVDWFDVFVHGAPATIAALRVWRELQLRGQTKDPQEAPANASANDTSDSDSES